MKKNSYRIDKDILTIRSLGGQHSFKVEDSGSTGNLHHIAQMMVSELVKAEESLSETALSINPYVLVLLANLKLSKKYVDMRDRLDRLTRTLEEKTKSLGDLSPKGQLEKQVSQNPTSNLAPPEQPEPMEPEAPLTSETTENFKKTSRISPDFISSSDQDLSPESEATNIPSPPKAKATETQEAPEEPPTTPATPNTPKTLEEPLKTPETPKTSEAPKAPGTPKTAETVKTQSPRKISEPLEASPLPKSPPAHSPLLEEEPESNPQASSMPDNHGMEQPAAPPSVTRSVPPSVQSVQGEEPLILNRSEKKDVSCHGPSPAKVSFPIHTALSHSHTGTNYTPSEEEKEESTEKNYQLPQLGFLKSINSKTEVDHESIRRDAELLEKKLGYFGIKGEVMGVSPGPVITTFEYKPAPGIKISKIVNLADDLALALSAYSIRIVAPIPGRDVMGIEIPNLKKSIVPFIDIVSSNDFTNCPSKLPICLGKDIIGNPVVVQLESMPHLLIAGATGTGKSVGLNAMITSILYKANPDEVKFLMIDPKRIELSLYNDIPHLITPVITDMKKATNALQWMVREMERRYDLLAESQVRNIEQFNQKIKRMDGKLDGNGEPQEPLSYIVIIIDELADLMMTASRDVELSLTRLAQMARAAGIHLILATQRPSVDVLTGIIKANFPTRISFQVSSKTDSRTIIDSNGAETLLGMGDMLFVPPGTSRLTRVHGTYLSEEELIDITAFIKDQQAPDYLFDVITEIPEEPDQDNQDDEYDEKYQDALEVVMATRQASISGVQRALRVGYNRAARIIDIMEKKGIVGPSDGAKPRQVLRDPMD